MVWANINSFEMPAGPNSLCRPAPPPNQEIQTPKAGHDVALCQEGVPDNDVDVTIVEEDDDEDSGNSKGRVAIYIPKSQLLANMTMYSNIMFSCLPGKVAFSQIHAAGQS